MARGRGRGRGKLKANLVAGAEARAGEDLQSGERRLARNQMIVATIESPYAAPPGEEELLSRNILYARMACAWAFREGYLPFASHLIFTQPGILDDADPQDRRLGIAAGFAISRRASVLTLVFEDLGISPGMEKGIKEARIYGRRLHHIRMFAEDIPPNISRSELLAMALDGGIIKDYSRKGWPS